MGFSDYDVMKVPVSEFIDRNWSHKLRLRDSLTMADKSRSPLLDSYENSVELYVTFAEWNDHQLVLQDAKKLQPLFQELMGPYRRQDTFFQFGVVRLDIWSEDLPLLCGDDTEDNLDPNVMPVSPEYLPFLMFVIRRRAMPKGHIKVVSALSATKILRMWREGHANDATDAAKREIADEIRAFGLSATLTSAPRSFPEPLRIFVSGDRMSVGKTSVCLGILGNLVQMGYSPQKLAYIKPATQNESPQLVQMYCEMMGISCIPVGPIVYYRGFTRAFLAGETESSEQLLEQVADQVDELAEGKDVVIIDGVGFPAVGSICGTDNATVALASSYPNKSWTGRKPLGVLLVGGPGVGSAVDAFNLNATYFERFGLPVLGVIFNKLSLEGFYSLENCKEQISLYFSRDQYQVRQGRKPFGFCPLFPKLGGNTFTDNVFEYIQVFGDHVNTKELLETALEVQQRSTPTFLPLRSSYSEPPSGRQKSHAAKRQKLNDDMKARIREEIETKAIHAGAAPSA
jgi:dethiobiotin synthetase